ncbi:MAG: hypothetical protein ABI556_03525 [Gemmatimonadales bacterium]
MPWVKGANRSMKREPSAVLPIIMSLVAFGIVLVHYAVKGMDHDPDEGTPAHLFQLLMVIQAPIIVYFAAKWLPLDTTRALRVLALQGAAIVAAFAGVFFLT